MTEDDLRVFIQGTERFFSQTTTVPVKVSTPFIMENDDRVVYDFSAVIGVSGSQRGCVYYSAPRDMVSELVKRLGENQLDDEIFADYVGEIANTVAGNAREHFDSNFMISVPVVFMGDSPNNDVHFPREIPAFVIPLEWSGHQSSLIICLRDEKHTDDDETAAKIKAVKDDVEGEAETEAEMDAVS